MSLRQANKLNRQKLIVANSARLFSSIGYDKTTIESVAERSNVSPATIYNNFENKTGLLLAVLIDEGEDVQQIGKKVNRFKIQGCNHFRHRQAAVNKLSLAQS